MHLLGFIVPRSTNLKHFHTEQNSSSSLQNKTKLSPEDAKGSCSAHPPIPNPINSKLRESLRSCESSSCSSALLLEGREGLQAFPECSFLRDFVGIARTPRWAEQSRGIGRFGKQQDRTRAVLQHLRDQSCSELGLPSPGWVTRCCQSSLPAGEIQQGEEQLPAGLSELMDPRWLREILSPPEGASHPPTAFPGLV